MKNIIRINLDVNERNESNIGIPLPQKVIRSKDTAVIIEMRIIGYDVNDGYTFTLLSEYTKSKRHTLYTLGDRLKIEGNVVTFVPPAELISTLEIVTNTLYIEKSGVSLDFSKFHYLAQLSEVDNTVGPVKEVYDDNYQALIDELEFKYMLIEDLTAEYVAAQVAEARVGEDGTIYRFLKERLDVEHQKVIAQVGEVTNQLELTNNEIIDARGGKPTLRVRLNEIDRVDETGKHWTLIDGEWEERVGQSQLINVRGEVAWAMAEAEQAREDTIKAYEYAVAEAKRAADIEDALIRTKIEQEISAVEEELSTAKQEAQDAYTNAVAEAEAKVQAKDEEYKLIFGEYDSTIESIETESQTAKTKAEQALTEAGISTDLAQTAKDLATTAQTNASTAISNASQALADASTAVSDASQAKADASQAQEDAQTAITEAGEALDSANTAKTNAQTALADAQTALSTAENADTKSGLAEAAANTAKTNAQTAIDDAQSALTTAGTAKTTADTLSIKVDDLEGEVELKASQTEVDGISGTVSTHTTTLSQHATAISSKAESELVDTIKGTVDTHTTEISQNATDIASKANTATVNTLTGRVDTAESNISQNATAITQRVTTTTYNTGIANKENTVLKQTTAPTHVNGRLWLDTSVTPNILKRSNGTTWIKATPTTPGEVGAYSQVAGAGLAGRLTTAETNITQTATAIISKADKSTVDTLAGTVSTQGTTITQQADLIASKASQTEVDTVKGTVAGHTTTISQHATQIASKAETNLVNAIKGTVDNHTTEISQNATDIASKASSSSVNTLTGRVSTAETTISQHATAITSKASQEEVDTVKGTVSGHTTTLSQHATAIASKAESNLVNAIKSTVDTHTTEISQNATDIASKASSTSVNTLTGRVSDAETTISQNATAITSKASQSEVDTVKGTVSGHTSTLSQHASQISARLTSSQVSDLVDDKGLAKVTYVDNQINATADSFGVELTKVEGKIPTDYQNENLLSESTNLSKWRLRSTNTKLENKPFASSDKDVYRVHRVDTSNTVVIGIESDSTFNVIEGQTYTISFDFLYYFGGYPNYNYIMDDSTGYNIKIEETMNNEGLIDRWVHSNAQMTRQSITFVAQRSVKNARLLMGLWDNRTDIIGFYLSRIKIERGNKATPYVLSLADLMVEEDFTVFKNNYQSTVDGITSELSKTAKLTDLNGMVTESYLTTNQYTTQGQINTQLIDYLKTTDLNGKVKETVAYQDIKETTDRYTRVIGSTDEENRTKIAQIAMTDSLFQTTVRDSVDIGGSNIVPNTDMSIVENISKANRWATGTDVWRQLPPDYPEHFIYAGTDNQEIGYTVGFEFGKATGDGFSIIKDQVYTLSFLALSSEVQTHFNYMFIMRNSGGNQNFSNLINVKMTQVGVAYTNVPIYKHEYTFKASWSDTDAWLLIGSRTSKVVQYQWIRVAQIQLEKGNVASDWSPSPLDKANQSQVTQLSDSWALTLKSGNDIKTQINASTDSIRLASKFIHLSGTSLIDNTVIKSAHIDSLNANKITGNTADFNTIRAGVLTTDAVTSTHIKSDNALIDNIFATQALVDRLWAKAIWTNKITTMDLDAGQIKAGTINAARLNVTDLRADILTANVIDAVQINGSAALFNKLFSTSSATSRLVAQGAWITNANIISLNADKITAGTINANRISISSLANLNLGGTNLLRWTNFENSFDRDRVRAWSTTSIRSDKAADFPNRWYVASHINQPVGTSVGLQIGNIIQDRIYIRQGKTYTLSFLTLDSGTVQNSHYTYMHLMRQEGGNASISHAFVSKEQVGVAFNTMPVYRHIYTFDAPFTSQEAWIMIATHVSIVNQHQWIRVAEVMLEEGNKASAWSPAPLDQTNKGALSMSGSVEIHGGNIKADTLDVGAITGDLGEFINLSLKAQNSQASLSGASFRIESIANNQSYIEMSNAPEIRARSADSSMAVMGQGRTSYHYDGSERFYFGSKLNGWQNGMMIRKHHGWGIMRESDSSNGVPAKYYQVPAGYQRVAVVEALMRDPSVTEVPTGNETQFIINSNYLGRLNGYTNSTSSTVAYPWPTLRTGDLIKYAEEIPGNESGVQQVFDIWDDNNTTVSAFGVHVTFHGGYSGASDRNIKHDIKDTAVEALAHIESLTFKEFRYNQDNRYEPIGIIAQDSGILRVKSDKVESVDIQRSIMLSLKGLQELQDIVKRQEEEINEQAEEIKQLKEIINQ